MSKGKKNKSSAAHFGVGGNPGVKPRWKKGDRPSPATEWSAKPRDPSEPEPPKQNMGNPNPSPETRLGAPRGPPRSIGGRGRAWAEMKAAASEYGAEALETLVIIMRECRRDPATDEFMDHVTQPELVRASGAAAAVLLDRGFGKPEQKVRVEDADKLDQIARLLLAPEPADDDVEAN
jgi:hypothetical protein